MCDCEFNGNDMEDEFFRGRESMKDELYEKVKNLQTAYLLESIEMVKLEDVLKLLE